MGHTHKVNGLWALLLTTTTSESEIYNGTHNTGYSRTKQLRNYLFIFIISDKQTTHSPDRFLCGHMYTNIFLNNICGYLNLELFLLL